MIIAKLENEIKTLKLDLLKTKTRFELFKQAVKGICKSIEYYKYVERDAEIDDRYDEVMKPLWIEIKVGLDENPSLID